MRVNTWLRTLLIASLIGAMRSPSYALVVGYEPDVTQIELLASGVVTAVTAYDTPDVTIQICQISLNTLVYDKNSTAHSTVINLIYNVNVKNTTNATAIGQATKVMLWHSRTLLTAGESYYFPVKWSPELLAYVCYDKWDGVWQVNDKDYQKVEGAMKILKPQP
jgi:hypothetical protein